jgi:hypothetical protein
VNARFHVESYERVAVLAKLAEILSQVLKAATDVAKEKLCHEINNKALFRCAKGAKKPLFAVNPDLDAF